VAIERFYQYDWKGQLTGKTEVLGTRGAGGRVAGETFETTYDEYDRLGNLLRMTYPSGLTAAFAYADGGSLAAVGVNGDEILGGIRYAANGAPDKMTLSAGGGSVDWARAFNNRFWPERILVGPGVDVATPLEQANVLFGLVYPDESYEGNGNIREMWRFRRERAGTAQDWLGGVYTYDRLNRLASARVVIGGEGKTPQDQLYAYSMDEFGNVLGRSAAPADPALPRPLSVSVSPATNRLLTADYDLLGNQTTLDRPDAQPDLRLVYQDQGHVHEVRDAAGTTLLYRYYYDADGKRRIKARATAGGATVVTNPGGEAVLVDDCSFSFYEGEELICQQDRGGLIVEDLPGQPGAAYYGTKFLLLDHLGTTRAELEFTDVSGTPTPTVSQPYDTMPYGELISPPPTLTEGKIFTGKIRDRETEFDIFDARTFSSLSFRWVSADRNLFSTKHFATPQKWNLYAYVLSNPLNHIDPNGLEEENPNPFLDTILQGTTPQASSQRAAQEVDEEDNVLSQTDGESQRGFLTDTLKKAADALDGALSQLDVTGAYNFFMGAYQKDGTRMAGALFTMGSCAQEASSAGLGSFRALKKELGPAGAGKEWHHLVEQSQVGKFGKEMIHNIKNVIALPKEVHRKISAYYSSKQAFTGGLTVREWIGKKSFKEQYDFAIKVLKQVMKQ
jgi:RHS repeat-associated protein